MFRIHAFPINAMTREDVWNYFVNQIGYTVLSPSSFEFS